MPPSFFSFFLLVYETSQIFVSSNSFPVILRELRVETRVNNRYQLSLFLFIYSSIHGHFIFICAILPECFLFSLRSPMASKLPSPNGDVSDLLLLDLCFSLYYPRNSWSLAFNTLLPYPLVFLLLSDHYFHLFHYL